MTFRRWAIALAILTPLTGCISVSETRPVAARACAPGETSRQVAELTFGRNIGQALGVSEADFTAFLDEEVSPRFPDGLTVWDTQGRWLDKGVVYKEPGKRLSLILPGRPDDHRKLGEIAAAYERRFRQDAVLSTVRTDCVTFWLPDDAKAR